ncbi:unannotated protein [freshwater metagenome]|uniref:Cysteine--tRNA ligase n=1 Tax=freshwater metagenome TaxID=449393 RepID=A0A6J7XQJ1_9ZZZZ
MLSLYNTQTRTVDQVTTQSDGSVAIYCCGPTVYRDAHVGNMRTFLLGDLVTRAIRATGKNVKIIQNITDVGHMSEDLNEDKMLLQSQAESIDPFAVARKYEEKFHGDLALLNIESAQSYPRASESIELMHALISQLISQGNAYVGDDKSVYFSAQSFESYGAISGNRLDALKPGHRYEFTEGGAKRFHADWALWKFAGTRTKMIWDSPWGPGFPGWHIECSAMSLHFLGPKINVHIGGIDLRFPHHENERAQTNSITGGESVDLWLHGEHLLFEGRKMSKSAGNVVLVSDLLERGIDPLSLRLCFLENRYRSQMDLSWDSIKAAQVTIKRWRKKLQEWGPDAPILQDQEILKAVMTDLDMPRVISRLRVVEKDSEISPIEKVGIFKYAEQLIALDLLRGEIAAELPQEAHELLAAREIARSEKNWKLSDELREKLENFGLEIKDLPQSQEWQWR